MRTGCSTLWQYLATFGTVLCSVSHNSFGCWGAETCSLYFGICEWGKRRGGGAGGIFLGAVVYINIGRGGRAAGSARVLVLWPVACAVERETLQRAKARDLQAFKDTLSLSLLRGVVELSLQSLAR